MFTQLSSVNSRRQRSSLLISLSLHGLALAWLLHAPEPLLLNPVSVRVGRNGNSLTRLYWANKSPDNRTHSSSDKATERYRHQRLGREQLTRQTPPQAFRPPIPPAHTPQQDDSPTQTLSALGHGTQAGPPYGTLNRGQLYGNELRPALPIATSDPAVYPWQLPNTPGNEVIEITIDERGDIVRKVVLQSLGPEIDSKCLAALDNWHFHPATRNGTPISSKQDAIFPFKARG